MATATKTKLKNFIDGEFVDAADGQTEDVVNPATGEAIAEAPLSTKEDVDRAVAAAQEGLRDAGASTTPARARAGAAEDRRRDRGEARTRSPTSRPPTPASRARRSSRTRSRSMVDSLRFFAGAARCMEGKAAGEYMEGYTSMIRREPIGVVGQITPWNYPLMMAIWKIGPALADGQHDRAEAGRDDPDHDPEARRDGARRSCPPGVLNVIGGHGEPAGAALVTHPDVDMVSLTGSPATGKWIAAGRVGDAEAGPPRARRQGAGGRLRRRRDGDRDGDDRRHRLLQRRPGLHRGDPRARLQGRLRRRRQRPRRAGQGPGRRRHAVDADTTLGPRQLRAPARAGRGLPRAQARQRRDRHRRQASPTCPASTSSRPWSPGSSRTTR